MSMTAQGTLGRILNDKRQRLLAAQARVSLADLEAGVAAAPAPRDFAAALRRPPGTALPRVIAEIKRASPSAGPIRPGIDPAAVAAEYEAAGAAAVSVLTEETFFDGALAHLTAARARVAIPILRKDFLIDEWQLFEARAAGADAVLLIVAALDDVALRRLLERARVLRLAALVEVHDATEAERAVAAGATIVGVNHRNLTTLEIDLTLFSRIRPLLPAATITVAESGLRSSADVHAMAAAGADAILVGESLMRKPSPGAALSELLA